MRAFTLDNKAVRCPNATTIGFAQFKVKRGDVFSYGGFKDTARSLGRIKWCDSEGADCRGHICALVLHETATFAYIRWIDPKDVTEVQGVPTKFAAFFFAPQWAYDNDMLLRLSEYGTLCEQHIDWAPHHVEAWQAGISPAIYKGGYHPITGETVKR